MQHYTHMHTYKQLYETLARLKPFRLFYSLIICIYNSGCNGERENVRTEGGKTEKEDSVKNLN